VNGRPIARRSRAPLPGRRTRTVRRASAGLSATRAGASLALLASVAGIYGVATSSAFAYARLQVDGTQFTDPHAVEAAISVARGQNLFRLETGPLVGALEKLPTVRTARVDVHLPGTIAVTVNERKPVLIWQVGGQRFLVDADGALFAALSAKPPADAAALPVIDDRRAASTSADATSTADAVVGLTVGAQIDPVDLDAATRLASLVPGDIGSSAVSLSVSVTDENGFVVGTRPGSWSAVFGFYTPSLRTTEMIPGQVRLLRSLLIGREPVVDRIILASETDGTYTPRAASSGSPKASVAP
jgi:POTRA domain-containing FtsQ-type protein